MSGDFAPRTERRSRASSTSSRASPSKTTTPRSPMKSSISSDREAQAAQWIALTRHFFDGFFRLGFLDDRGEESFKRAMIGVLAAIVAIGLFAARVYLSKYYRLAGQPTADAYRWALAADQLFM